MAEALVEDTKKNPELYPSLWKIRTDKQGLTRILAELVCLVYHEARNVRHPIKAGELPNGSKYAKLVSLPKDRQDAWGAMAGMETQTVAATSAAEVVGAFERHFGLTLTDLEALYRAPVWKASAYGGNRWAPICAAVMELAEAVELGEVHRRMELFDAIPKLRHNTGTVEDKLRGLHARRG